MFVTVLCGSFHSLSLSSGLGPRDLIFMSQQSHLEVSQVLPLWSGSSRLRVSDSFLHPFLSRKLSNLIIVQMEKTEA